jgi:hypothetical protein
MVPLKLFPSQTRTLPGLIEEAVEMADGVLVKATEVGLEDSDGITTVVDDETCNKGERTDEEEEKIIDGNPLERLSSITLSRLLRSVCRGGGPLQDRLIR